MPTFAEYEAAMVAGLKQVEGITDVKEFAESLDAAALKKIAPRDSGILMVALGGLPAREQPDTGQFAWVARTGAFIVTRNARGSLDRTQAARALAQSVMLKINQFQWGLSGVYGAQIDKLENRSSGKADAAGYAIWLVVWKQTIHLNELPVDNTPVPTGVHIGTDGMAIDPGQILMDQEHEVLS